MASLKSRADVLSERKWKLEDILNEADIPKILSDIRLGFGEIAAFRNKLTPENAIECLLIESKVAYKIEKVYVYAHMRSDEDKSQTVYQELTEQISMLSAEFGTVTSFISPTLAKFKTNDLIAMRDSEEYHYYSMYIDGVLRNKKHLLSAKEEALLSGIASFGDDFQTVFMMFDNVDIKMGEIEVNGEKIGLSHGTYSVLMQNPNQKVREKAFHQLYDSYIGMINTIAANYTGNVKQDAFFAKTRKYKGCLEKALYRENIPAKVFHNLIESVEEYTPLMHKYMALRKKALNLSELHMYDLYVPIVKDRDTLTGYDEAYETVITALAPLGDEYVSLLRAAKTDGWIDVEETASKRSGAYSWGVYGVHPYVLLNHKGTTHDVFTIAHEMGHAMHSYYSNREQCYEKAAYVIFVAEIASTVNEVLLIKHLLKTATGEDRIYLLSYYIDMIRTTLFRQTMFAEFERFSHRCIEQGEPLSAEKMSEYYRGLNKKYYGDAVVVDDKIGYEWARIPHFYRDFYVYKYATGITTAINIANKILKKPESVSDYYKFLSAGGSMYPIDIIQLVGIDLTTKAPFRTAMKEFASVLSELEELLGGNH